MANEIKTQKPLEILLVDDKQENIDAAMQYLKTRNDIKVDIATTYEEAVSKLESKVYALSLFDLELPKRKGDPPEKLGYELAKIADEMTLTYVIVTSGIDHHKCKSAFIKISFDPYHEKPVESPCGLIRTTERPKNKPEIWKILVEFLIDGKDEYEFNGSRNAFYGEGYKEDLIRKVESLERYKNFFGKPYRRKNND